MGIFDKILSGFEKNTYRSIASAMLRAYQQAKIQNPSATERELSALAFEKRPTWKREKESFNFKRGKSNLTIEEGYTLQDVIREVIIIETMPSGAYQDPEFTTNVLIKISQAISEVLGKN